MVRLYGSVLTLSKYIYNGYRQQLPAIALALLFFIATAQPLQAVAFRPLASNCSGPVAAEVGSCAPEIASPDSKLGQLTTRAEVTVVHFWATWCEPCKEELPILEGLAKRMVGQAVRFVAIALDEDESTVDQFFAGRRPALTLVVDANKEISRRYQTSKVPETFIVDPQGRIRDKIVGTPNWRSSMTQNYLGLLAGGCRSQHKEKP